MRTGEYPDDWAERREAVLERDGYECRECGSTNNLEVDHVIPISEGGSHDLDNLQTLCHACHTKKHPVQTKLRQAISQNRRIRMKYHSNSGTRVRKLNPYGLGMYEGVQYLVGYDHFRNGRRYFRPKKIEWLEITDEKFSPPEDFDVDEYLSRKVTSRKSACFIATAAFGTPQAEEIDRLRKFRDDVLLQNLLGVLFVKIYYLLSPPVAEWITRREWRRKLVRKVIIRPTLWLAQNLL